MTRYRIYPQEHLATASRAELEAWLAIERADLLAQLTGLDERILCEQPVMEGWTAKDLLAHVAHWDAFFTESVDMALAGRASEVPDVNLDERNAAVYAARRGWSLAATLQAFSNARTGFLKAFGYVPMQMLHVEQPFGWGRAAVRRIVKWRGYHDSNHADQIATWRKGLGPISSREQRAGSKPVLMACLHAYRAVLLALIALIPAAERETRLICGAWTLKDVVGHIADWERFCVEAVRAIVAGHSADLDYDGDYDAWNAAHVTVRQGQPWPAVWADFEAVRRDLLALLDGLSEADLNRPVEGRWGGTSHRWMYVCLDHDREHAQDLAKLLGIAQE